MKRLHRPDLYGWSAFDEARNIDFNSVAWIRAGGNVLIDPLPLSAHDRAHLESLGGAAWIVLTNSMHVRAARELATEFSARLAGPAAESASFPVACDRWLRSGDEVVPGLRALELHGGKTPGELALILEETTLITGDLVRAHMADGLHLLPRDKLADPAQVAASVQELAALPQIRAILVGDGFSIYRDGHARLRELSSSLAAQRAAS